MHCSCMHENACKCANLLACRMHALHARGMHACMIHACSAGMHSLEGLFKHTFGKTLRGKNSNTFKVKKCSNTTVCPVSNLLLYVQLCDLMTVNLRDGHLFRTTNKSTVSTSPFIGSAVASRLVQHLKTLDIHNSESMHSFRSGCSITLSLLGVTSEEVARHVGWRSLDNVEYYTQTKKVFNMSNTMSVLASSTTVTPSGAVASASSVAQVFRAKNELPAFPSAFP